jgi:hypothetical protein
LKNKQKNKAKHSLQSLWHAKTSIEQTTEAKESALKNP